MEREYPISFSGNFREKVPTNILEAIEDVEGVLLKSSHFEKEPPKGMDVDEAMNLNNLNLEEKAERCFPIGSVWKRQDFERNLTHFCTASTFKFSYTCDSSTSFQCCKYGNPRKKKGETVSTKNKNSMKCGCEWRIITSNLWTYPPKKKGGERQKWLSSPPNEEEKNKMYIVVKSLPEMPHNHAGDKTTYQDALKKGGHVSRGIGNEMVRNCLLLLNNKGFLTNQDIRTFGHVCTPSCVVWDSKRCDNWKKKMYRLSKALSPEQYETQKAFEASFMSSKIQEMFKDDLGDAEFTDISSQRAREELTFFYSERFQRLDPDTQESVIDAWFKRMRKIDPFFDYELMLNEDKEITGVVWMTGQMRRDLEDLGDHLMMDMMKKETNTSLFLYAAIVLHRADQSLCVACEALLLNESILTYKFLCDATFRMAFEIKKEDVDIIAGDEFLDQDKIRNDLGFPNAHFVFDQFHLIQVNLRRKFTGTNFFEILENDIYKWINARSEVDFDHEFENLLKKMSNLNCAASHFNAIKDLEKKKDHFAFYKLRSYKGTIRRLGNQGSESNHASVARHLNSNALLEIPHLHSILSNRQVFFDYRAKNNYESQEREIRFENSQVADPILVDASSCIYGQTLNSHGYKLLYEQYRFSKKLNYAEDEDGNFVFDDGITLQKNKACTCEYRVADKIQCCHEIKRSNNFDVKCFATRYIYNRCPWERRLPRNGVDTDDLDNGGSTRSKTSTKEAMDESNSSHDIDTDNLDYEEEESSVQFKSFNFNEIAQTLKNVATSISRRPFEFRKRACAVLHELDRIARSDTVNVNMDLSSLLNSYVQTEQEHLHSSKTTDPPRKSNTFASLKKRVLFGHERKDGSSGIAKGKTRSLITSEAIKDAPKGKKKKHDCSFCNHSSCKSTKARDCPKLKEHGGIVIARSGNEQHDRANQQLKDSLRFGKICPPSTAKNAPKGTFGRNSLQYNKHFILHSVHLKNGAFPHLANNPDNVMVLVTAIDSEGNINTSCLKCLVSFNDFLQFIDNRAERTRFIFDRREDDQVNAIERHQMVNSNIYNGMMPFPSQGNPSVNAGSMQVLPTTTSVSHLPIPGMSQGTAFGTNNMTQAFPFSQPNNQVYQPVITQGYNFPSASQECMSGIGYFFNGNGMYNSHSQPENEKEEKEFEK